MVEHEFSDVKLTAAPRNLGYGAANNLAIREGSAEWVLVLNPDARVPAGALDTLRKTLDRFYRDHYAPSHNPAVNGMVYAGIAGKLGISLVRNAIATARRREVS